MSLPTFSRADLLLECGYWAHPDRILPREEAGSAARFGTEAHRIAAKLLDPDPAKRIAVSESEEASAVAREACNTLERWMAPEGNPHDADFASRRRLVETSFAINLRDGTARRCESPREEDHVYTDVDPTCEMPGTIDLGLLPVAGRSRSPGAKLGVVLDLKTGHSHYRPIEMAQLWMGALALHLAHKVNRVILAVLHAQSDGGPPQVYATEPLTPAQLRNFQKRITRAWKRRLDGSLRPGAHCGELYCPAFSICPSKVNALAEVAPVAALTRLGTPAEIGKAHEMLSIYKKLERTVEAWIERSIREGGAPGARPDGKLVILRPTKRRNLSMASIKRALGDVAGQRRIDQLEKEGCITTSEFDSLVAVSDDGR